MKAMGKIHFIIVLYHITHPVTMERAMELQYGLGLRVTSFLCRTSVQINYFFHIDDTFIAWTIEHN